VLEALSRRPGSSSYSDRGCQDTALASDQSWRDAGALPSDGSAGDGDDNTAARPSDDGPGHGLDVFKLSVSLLNT
jgi:hypothetical protein